jgi:transketolase
MSQVVPLTIKKLLAGNPQQDPRYSVSVRTRQGVTYLLGDPKATRAMVALMDMQAVMGGAASHFGGPAAFAELMSAVHGVMYSRAKEQGKEWHELFHFVNDAGHCENGLYALKANYGFADLSLESLKGFRSMTSRLTGHGESHLFPEGVYLSNGPLGSSLPQTQGLAYADAKMGNMRVTVTAISDGASFEGEAREAYAAIPGLAARGDLAPYICIISDNNTKLTGRIASDSFDMQPTFRALAYLGWKVIQLEEGNNLTLCVEAFEHALNEALAEPTKPVVIHAKTIKGFGVKKAVESPNGGHGFPLKTPEDLPAFLEEIYEGGTVPQEFLSWAQDMQKQWVEKSQLKSVAPKEEKVQVGVTKALVKARQEGLPVISVTSDLPGSTGLAGFIKTFPEAAVDVGVAESNMVSMAAGLSKQGFIPVVDTFAQFGVTKGALPMMMASLSQAPMIAIFSHTGFQDAADGASHQALTYFSMMSPIPHVDVYALSSSSEAEALVGQAVAEFAKARQQGRVPNTSVFFLGREDFAPSYLPEGGPYQLGCAQIVEDTSGDFAKSICLVAAGSLLPQALIAADSLAKKGVGAIVINPSSINKPDVKTVRLALEKTEGRIVTVEDHQVICGMGAQLVQALLRDGVVLRLRALGVEGGFGQSSYTALELYQKHGLDSVAIAKAAQALI